MKQIILILIVAIFVGYGFTMLSSQMITIQKYNSNSYNYEEYRKVTKKKEVGLVWNIIKNAEWRKTKSSPKKNADYKFQFPNKNRSEDTKLASYSIWLYSNGFIELINDNGEYVKLSKADSSILIKIIIG
jgi:hypothetical protein